MDHPKDHSLFGLGHPGQMNSNVSATFVLGGPGNVKRVRAIACVTRPQVSDEKQ